MKATRSSPWSTPPAPIPRWRRRSPWRGSCRPASCRWTRPPWPRSCNGPGIATMPSNGPRSTARSSRPMRFSTRATPRHRRSSDQAGEARFGACLTVGRRFSEWRFPPRLRVERADQMIDHGPHARRQSAVRRAYRIDRVRQRAGIRQGVDQAPVAQRLRGDEHREHREAEPGDGAVAQDLRAVRHQASLDRDSPVIAAPRR